jgi:hypothetical protein
VVVVVVVYAALVVPGGGLRGKRMSYLLAPIRPWNVVGTANRQC